MNTIPNRRRLKVATTLLAVFLVLLLFLHFFRPDPELAKAMELRQQLRSEDNRKLPPDKRRELFQKFNQQVRQLKPEQRRALFQGQPNPMRERIDRYFTLSKKARAAFLDQEIKRMESMRGQRGPAGGPNAGFGAGPNGGNRPPSSAEDRDHRRRERLDQTTAEERARFAVYFQDLRQRRQQLGLPPMGGRGRA